MDAIGADASATAPVLLGWSFGGYVAHDVACSLMQAGHRVRGVVILDSVEQRLVRENAEAMEWMLRRRAFDFWLVEQARRFYPQLADRIAAVEDPAMRVRLLAEAALRAGTAARAGIEGVPDDPRLLAQFLRLWHGNELLLDGRPGSAKFPGPALVIRSAETQARLEDPALGWSDYYDTITCRDVPFDHKDLMLLPESTEAIATIVGRWLSEHVGDWMRAEPAPATGLDEAGAARACRSRRGGGVSEAWQQAGGEEGA